MKKALFLACFGLFLGISSVLASNMPDNSNLAIFSDFGGGLNTTKPPHKLNPNESPNLRNVFIEDGKIVRSPGYVCVGSSNVLTKGNLLYPFYKPNGEVEYIVSDSVRVLTTKDWRTYTLIRGGLSSYYNLQAVQVRDKIWFTNGTDSVFTWNGTTCVVLDGGHYGGVAYPNVPKGKYIDYWLDLVWIGNLDYDNSALRFCADYSTDTVPVAISPDSENAWPSTHELYIGRGDGQQVTSLFVYLNKLFVGKTNSIHTIYGQDVTDFVPKPTIVDVGIAGDDTVQVFDNYIYFLGRDGIYKSNGQAVNKISNNFNAEVDSIRKDMASIVYNEWSGTGFLNGYFGGSTYTSQGNVSVYIFTSSYTTIKERSGGLNIASTFTITEDYNRFPIEWILNCASLDQNAYYSMDTMTPWYYNPDGSTTVDVVIENDRLNTSSTYTWEVPATQGAEYTTQFRGGSSGFSQPVSTVIFKGSDFNNDCSVTDGNHAFFLMRKHATSNNFAIERPTYTYGVGHTLKVANSASYESDIATLSALTAWGTFEADYQTNNGNVQFFIRTATSLAQISTQTWSPISPGSIIASTISNNYIQWTATLSAISQSTSPILKSVVIQSVVGGVSALLPISVVFDNRYWLFGSTTSEGTQRLTFVKNKDSDNFTLLDGMNFYAARVMNNAFYAASSTSGLVYRNAYGTNYDGSTILSWYETGDVTFEDFFMDKKLFEYMISCEKDSSASMSIGTSINNGDYSWISINRDGDGMLLKNIKNINKNGNRFRFRFQNSELDKNFQINNFGVIYGKTAIRSE